MCPAPVLHPEVSILPNSHRNTLSLSEEGRKTLQGGGRVPFKTAACANVQRLFM